MIDVAITIFTVILVLLSLFTVLIILMQKTSSGMGSALAGGAAEQAFGGAAGNVLTRVTIYGIFAFFVISFGLYMAYQSQVPERAQNRSAAELMSGVALDAAVEAATIEAQEKADTIVAEAKEAVAEDAPKAAAEEAPKAATTEDVEKAVKTDK